MARITVEDCLQNENNRFALVLLAAKRAKQILQGSKVLSAEAKGNKAIVSSLREIAEGQVGFMSAEEVAEAVVLEEREAEERSKEAFEKLSQSPTETNGNALANKLRASAIEEDEVESEEVETEEVETEEVDTEEVDSTEIAADEDDESSDDDEEDPDTEAEEVELKESN